jgi:hypothetical protein
MQLVLALDHAFLRPREPVPPTIGFSIGLLFALPAMRNTQPEVPPIGVAVDVLGFFWNMSITALVGCSGVLMSATAVAATCWQQVHEQLQAALALAWPARRCRPSGGAQLTTLPLEPVRCQRLQPAPRPLPGHYLPAT